MKLVSKSFSLAQSARTSEICAPRAIRMTRSRHCGSRYRSQRTSGSMTCPSPSTTTAWCVFTPSPDFDRCQTKCTQLVAIEIAKIREIGVWTALAGSALVHASQLQRLCVERIDFLACGNAKSGHASVTDRGRLTVVRAEHCKAHGAALAVNASP